MSTRSSVLPGPEPEEGFIHPEGAMECDVQEQVEEDDHINPVDFLRQLQVPSPPKNTVGTSQHGDDVQSHSTHITSSNFVIQLEAARTEVFSSTQETSQSVRSSTPLEMPIACTECRVMKTRCTRLWPTCSRCARKGYVCVYPDPAKMGRPPKRKLNHVSVSESSSESLSCRGTIHPNQSDLQSLSDSLFRVPHNGFPDASPPTSPPCIISHDDDYTSNKTLNSLGAVSLVIGQCLPLLFCKRMTRLLVRSFFL